jgi:hypothetical protein
MLDEYYLTTICVTNEINGPSNLAEKYTSKLSQCGRKIAKQQNCKTVKIAKLQNRKMA